MSEPRSGEPELDGGISVDRLGAFSDGVFAIAATLLVLSLRTPELHEGQSLLSGLGSQWAQLVAYVLTFLTIGSSWLGHRALVAGLRRDTVAVQVWNLLVLLLVALLPFPTTLIADLHNRPDAEGQAVALLSACMAALGLAMTALDRAGSPRSGGPRLTPGRLGPLLYALAVPVSLLSPLAGLLVDLATTLVFLLAPHRLAPGRRRSLRRALE